MSTHAPRTKMSPRSIAVFVFAATAVAFVLAACGVTGGSVGTAGAWARPATAGGETAAYLVVTNAGSTADTLVSASSPDATSVELHQTSTDASGMTGMQSMDGVAIPAGATVTMAAGSMHLMVMGLAKDLVVGGSLDLELTFRSAGTVKVRAEIKQP